MISAPSFVMPMIASHFLDLGLLAEDLENLFEAFHLPARLALVFYESGLQVLRLSRLCHLRQGRQNLLFSEIHVLERVVKQIAQQFRFFSHRQPPGWNEHQAVKWN